MSSGMSFPMILKLSLSRGTHEAHHIYVTSSEAQLKEFLTDPALQTNILVENLVNHSENFLIKAYIIGEEGVYFFVKYSLPDMVIKTGHKFENTKHIN
jgi:hypothetical protein